MRLMYLKIPKFENKLLISLRISQYNYEVFEILQILYFSLHVKTEEVSK